MNPNLNALLSVILSDALPTRVVYMPGSGIQPLSASL